MSTLDEHALYVIANVLEQSDREYVDRAVFDWISGIVGVHRDQPAYAVERIAEVLSAGWARRVELSDQERWRGEARRGYWATGLES